MVPDSYEEQILPWPADKSPTSASRSEREHPSSDTRSFCFCDSEDENV